MKFTATVLLSGKTTTGVVVPPEVVDALGAGRRPKVFAIIGDYTFRNSVAPMNDCYMLPINAGVRKDTGIRGGDVVEIDLRLDTEPREVAVPADLAAALSRAPGAEEFFTSLSYANRKWHVDQAESAKTAETRSRRIERSIAMLAARKAR
jgi:Bacteriocin-protection, YdeI or OmpD-Associated/Domain of unknown function (DUF1905)